MLQKIGLLALILVLLSCQQRSQKETVIKKDFSDSPTSVSKIDGSIFFSNDNGRSWESKASGLPDSVQLGIGAIAVSGDSLAIATKKHGVFSYNFQKDLWTSIPTNSEIIKSDPGTLAFFKNQLFIGTRTNGVYKSSTNQKSWTHLKEGLSNLTIRKLIQANNHLYAGTNGGLFVFDEEKQQWQLALNDPNLQVNGIASTKDYLLVATTQGIFAQTKDSNHWQNVFPEQSAHNIATENGIVYAMIYNELFISRDDGKTWQSAQKGLPAQLYTFNVVKSGNLIFAGQWDGIYTKTENEPSWHQTNTGLPENFAITNLKAINGTVGASGNIRQLRQGMTTSQWAEK